MRGNILCLLLAATGFLAWATGTLAARPFETFDNSGKAFGNLAGLVKYYEPPEISEIRIPDGPPKIPEYVDPQSLKTTSRTIAYDVVVKVGSAQPVVDGLERGLGAVGALIGAKTPETQGPLDTKDTTHYRFEDYQGALRLRVLGDGTFGLLVFNPPTDGSGRFLHADSLDIQNWKFLSKDEAINRLQHSLWFQTQVGGAPDWTFRHVFQKTTGVKWGPRFAFLNPNRDKISEILRYPREQKMEISLHGKWVATTAGAFLKGDFPSIKTELSALEAKKPIRNYWVIDKAISPRNQAGVMTTQSLKSNPNPKIVVVASNSPEVVQAITRELPKGTEIKVVPYTSRAEVLKYARRQNADIVLGSVPDRNELSPSKNMESFSQVRLAEPPPSATMRAPGGVLINPEPQKAGKGGAEIKKRILESRPKEDAPSWPVK
ncbi:MAG: hypothetical protein D4R73_05535 [Deltaproteobacteria bacterium]|nr:MAG: hypothetical protein D4R73_05535 [Deltaproteobacteria bacterium]